MKTYASSSDYEYPYLIVLLRQQQVPGATPSTISLRKQRNQFVGAHMPVLSDQLR
jgi:hypothetical protein